MKHNWFYDPRSLKKLWLTRRFNSHPEIMWEYVCPKCGAYVGVSQSLCNCGHELKEEKGQLRVPPRWSRISFNQGVLQHDIPYLVELDKFLQTPRGKRILDEFIGVYALKKVLKLKHGRGRARRQLIRQIKANRDTLIDAAHAEMRATKDPRRRAWLAKHFTPLFSDGFELNAFSLWSGTSGSPIIETNNPHHGTYNMKASTTGSGQSAYANKSGLTAVTGYLRVYLKIGNSLPSSSQYILLTQYRNGTNSIINLFVRHDGTNAKWYFELYYNGGAATGYGTQPSLNTWYCCEIYAKMNDASTGEGIFYLDGSAAISHTGYDTTNYANVNQIFVGIPYTTSTGSHDVLIDCVTVADSGPSGLADAILEEEFVSGDFGNWNGTTEDSGCVVEILQTDPRNGTNHARFHVTATAEDYAYVSKNVSYLRAVHVRAYLKYMIALPASGKYSRPLLIRNSGSGVIVEVRVYNDSGTVKWRLGVLEGAGINYSTYTSGPSLDAWYCVEAFAQVDGSNGWGELRVDGSSILSDTGNDTDGRGNINLIRLGIINSDGATEHDVLIDSVVIQEFGPVGVDSFIAVIGHETGDGSEYTGTESAGNVTLAIATDRPLFGSYGVVVDSPDETDGYGNYYLTVSGQELIFSRIYMLTTALPDVDERIFIVQHAGTGTCGALGIYNDGGVVTWRMIYKDGGAATGENGASTPMANQWYCCELGEYVHAVDGYVKVWIDGALEIEETAIDTADEGNRTRVRVGDYVREGYSNTVFTMYLDYLTVSTSQIGIGYTFIDGFEDGDDTFPRWDGKTEAAGGTLVIESALSHCGDYCAKASDVQFGGSAYVHVDHSAHLSEAYIRGYFQFDDNLPDANAEFIDLFVLRDMEDFADRVRVGIDHNGANLRWQLEDGVGTDRGASVINLGTWYCVELYADYVDGNHVAWINGAEECSILGGVSGETVRYFKVGMAGSNKGGGVDTFTVYFDCIVIHTEYIGMEHLAEMYLETNDFSEFSSNSSTGTGVDEILNTDPHHGTYHAHFDLPAIGDTAYAYVTLNPTSVVHMRAYIKLISTDMGDANDYSHIMLIQSIALGCAGVYIRNEGGDGLRSLEIWGTSTIGWIDSGQNLNLGTYYCIELFYRHHVSAGGAKLWLDGALVCDSGDNDDTSARIPSNFYIGRTTGVASELHDLDFYVDCVVISRRYIGCEVVEAPPVGQPYISRVQGIPGMRTFSGVVR